MVTDDYPCFIVPEQSEALARKTSIPVFAVDSSSVVPLSLLGAPASAAAHLRPRIHKALPEAWRYRAAPVDRRIVVGLLAVGLVILGVTIGIYHVAAGPAVGLSFVIILIALVARFLARRRPGEELD